MLNANLVRRFGARRIAHGSLLGYIAFAVVHTGLVLSGNENLWSFALLQAGTMFCFGLIVPNFSSMAMEPLGHIAGTASAVQGFITTFGGALIGLFIGQQFDGTTGPLILGFTALWCAGTVHGALRRRRTPVPPAQGARVLAVLHSSQMPANRSWYSRPEVSCVARRSCLSADDDGGS
jgi:MFS family permease